MTLKRMDYSCIFCNIKIVILNNCYTTFLDVISLKITDNMCLRRSNKLTQAVDIRKQGAKIDSEFKTVSAV